MYPNIKLEVYQIPWENVKAKQTAMLLSGDADVLYTGEPLHRNGTRKGYCVIWTT